MTETPPKFELGKRHSIKDALEIEAQTHAELLATFAAKKEAEEIERRKYTNEDELERLERQLLVQQYVIDFTLVGLTGIMPQLVNESPQIIAEVKAALTSYNDRLSSLLRS